MHSFELRMIQMDLARQMETPETIRRQFRIFREAGYNAVLLYLEDRIRTETYPWSPDSESYTPEQMKELVRYASGLGLRLIPCVAALGHAERFLRHPQMAGLMEERPGVPGRASDKPRPMTFCIAREETQRFLRSYLAEIAEIFPDTVFHAGLDEAINFCFCPECREEARKAGGEDRLFLNHLFRLDELFHSLGKEMMMWSDMFEYYPNILPDVPKDIIMVDWLYSDDVHDYRGHYAGCERLDLPRFWKKSGIRSVIAGIDNSYQNMNSCVELAERIAVSGALTTTWEHAAELTDRFLPVSVYAGFRMNGQSDPDAFLSMCRMLFPKTAGNPVFRSALRLTGSPFRCGGMDLSDGQIVFTSCGKHAHAERAVRRLLLDVFQENRGQLEGDAAEDLFQNLTGSCLRDRISDAAQDILTSGWTEERSAVLKQAERELLAFQEQEMERFRLRRPGLCGAAEKVPAGQKAYFDKLDGFLKSDRRLSVQFALPDQFGTEFLRFVLTAGNAEYEIAQGVYKAPDCSSVFYERDFLLPDDMPAPETLRIEAWGFGGTGLRFAEVRIGEKRFIPGAVLSREGLVRDPEAILTDDRMFVWFGDPEWRKAWADHSFKNPKHVLSVSLKEAE